MMPKIVKIILPVIFWLVFGYVILKIDYPDAITSATIFQLLSFFISLFLALIFTANLFLNFIFSFFIALGVIILLILKSLDSLNIVSATLTIIALLLVTSYFRKEKKMKYRV